MADFVRIKDTENGNRFTAVAGSHYESLARFKVLTGKEALGIDGIPLPAQSDPLRSGADLTVEELRDIAAEAGVDLTGVTKKADILAAIAKAEEANA